MSDVPGNATTTSTVSVGGSVIGTLDANGDHDWYKIELQAGQKVVISLGGSGTSPVTDTEVYVRDSSGTLLGSDDDSGPGKDSQLVFTAPSSGTYYIDAAAWNDQYSGSYTLSVAP